MDLVADVFALPIALAAALGLLAGWACAGAASRGRARLLAGVLPWLALAGAGAAAYGFAGGRAALWLEAGGLMLAAYLAAGAAACGLRRLAAG